MPIYPPTEEPFECAICSAAAPRKWESPQMKSRAPLCWRCEQDWGTGPYGDCNPDRRVLKQISALAECIKVTAYCMDKGYEGPYG